MTKTERNRTVRGILTDAKALFEHRAELVMASGAYNEIRQGAIDSDLTNIARLLRELNTATGVDAASLNEE